MSLVNQFDKAVLERCGRLTIAERAKTGYYRKSDMDKAYKELYQNPRIQSRFGGGVAKMKQTPVGVFGSAGGNGSAVGDILPPRFGARPFNLGTSKGSVSMFSSDSDSETSTLPLPRSERMERMGANLSDVESQISADNSYWGGSVYPTQSEMDYDMQRDEQYDMDRQREENDSFLYDTMEVRAEDRYLEEDQNTPRRERNERQGFSIRDRTSLWSHEQSPQGVREILSGFPVSRTAPATQPFTSVLPPMTLSDLSIPEQAVPLEDAVNTQQRARI